MLSSNHLPIRESRNSSNLLNVQVGPNNSSHHDNDVENLYEPHDPVQGDHSRKSSFMSLKIQTEKQSLAVVKEQNLNP